MQRRRVDLWCAVIIGGYEFYGVCAGSQAGSIEYPIPADIRAAGPVGSCSGTDSGVRDIKRGIVIAGGRVYCQFTVNVYLYAMN